MPIRQYPGYPVIGGLPMRRIGSARPRHIPKETVGTAVARRFGHEKSHDARDAARHQQDLDPVRLHHKAVPVAGFSQLNNADRIWVAVNGFGR